MSEESQNAPLARIIHELARPLAESLNLSLWGIELAFSGRGLVRIFVEAENGVTVEQCAELSRLLGLALEVEDAIPGAYVLEVSSPGLERIFFTPEQLAGAVGETVEITMTTPVAGFSGRRKFRGILKAAPDKAEAAPGSFLLHVENPSLPGTFEGDLTFIFNEIKKARLLHIIPEKALPGKGGKRKSKTAESFGNEDAQKAGPAPVRKEEEANGHGIAAADDT